MFKSKIFLQITSWGLFFYKPVAHIKDVYKPNHFHQKRNGLKKSCNRFKQIREGITQKETITIKWNYFRLETQPWRNRWKICTYLVPFVFLLLSSSLNSGIRHSTKSSYVPSRIVDGQKAFSNSRIFDFRTSNILKQVNPLSHVAKSLLVLLCLS